MRTIILILLLFWVGVIRTDESYSGESLNGFDLSNSIIPSKEIMRGGPPKDGIPAIDKPVFIENIGDVELADDDYLLGVSYNGIVKAYPIAILNWHEIVNDNYGGDPVVITYCPLCGSGMAFYAGVSGDKLQFGVSGLLYNSDVLLYDRESHSLWSQILGQGVTGEYKGTSLQPIPVEHTTWKRWRTNYPGTKVLSFSTGFSRDYGRDPYAGYSKTSGTFFPVRFQPKNMHPKELVLAIELGGESKAYPLIELAKSETDIDDRIGDVPVTITYFPEHNSAIMTDEQGEQLPATTLFWFAWSAFHPDTEIYHYEFE